MTRGSDSDESMITGGSIKADDIYNGRNNNKQ